MPSAVAVTWRFIRKQMAQVCGMYAHVRVCVHVYVLGVGTCRCVLGAYCELSHLHPCCNSHTEILKS